MRTWTFGFSSMSPENFATWRIRPRSYITNTQGSYRPP
jgi:hypothetical protein